MPNCSLVPRNPIPRMEDILIPGWAVMVIIGMIGWLAWLTKETYQNQKAIAVNTNNDEKVWDDLEKIYKAIEANRQEHKEWFQKLETKIDIYIMGRKQGGDI